MTHPSSSNKQTIGLWAAIATTVGIGVSSSVMVSLAEGFGLGGRGFIFAMGAAFILNLLVALSFAELSGLIPRAGGLNRYTAPALGSTMSIIAVFSGYVLVTLFAGSAEAAIAGTVLAEVLGLGLPPLLISVLFVAVLVGINLLGVRVYGAVQIVLATALIGSIIVLGFIGLFGIGAGEPIEAEFPINPMGVGVLSLTALAFWLFIGVEFITPLAENVKKAKVYVPLSMVLGLLIIFTADVIFGFGALNYVLPEDLAGTENPHIRAAEALAGPTGFIWMGIVTFLATASTLNTLITAIPRMIATQAEEGEVPRVLALRNRNGVPWVAVLGLAVVFILFLLIGFTNTDSIVTFILASVFCWVLAYVIAHIDVIVLRVKYPHAARTFKSPGGFTVQILGIIGLVFIMFNISPDPEQAAQIYRTVFTLLTISVIYAVVWVKFVMKRGLFETTPLEDIIDSDHIPEGQHPSE